MLELSTGKYLEDYHQNENSVFFKESKSTLGEGFTFDMSYFHNF